MVKIAVLLSLLAGAEASLFLAFANHDKDGVPKCYAGRGGTMDEAVKVARQFTDQNKVLDDTCGVARYISSHPQNGYWFVNGNINYSDGRYHWWCKAQADPGNTYTAPNKVYGCFAPQ